MEYQTQSWPAEAGKFDTSLGRGFLDLNLSTNVLLLVLPLNQALQKEIVSLMFFVRACLDYKFQGDSQIFPHLDFVPRPHHFQEPTAHSCNSSAKSPATFLVTHPPTPTTPTQDHRNGNWEVRRFPKYKAHDSGKQVVGLQGKIYPVDSTKRSNRN